MGIYQFCLCWLFNSVSKIQFRNLISPVSSSVTPDYSEAQGELLKCGNTMQSRHYGYRNMKSILFWQAELIPQIKPGQAEFILTVQQRWRHSLTMKSLYLIHIPSKFVIHQRLSFSLNLILGHLPLKVINLSKVCSIEW